MDDAQRFLSTLFGYALDDSLGKILIWALKSKDSQFFDDVSAAAEHAERVGDTQDVYFGVGLQPDGLASNQRAQSKEVTALTAFGIDVDIAGAGHTDKKNYPPDQETIFEILKECPLKPTASIHSGGGIQLWWTFSEAWTFEKQEDRENAESLSRRWSKFIKLIYKKHNYDIDSVWDLARVMRVPGTSNHKTGTPRPVKLLSLDDSNRYHISDFEEFVEVHAFSPENDKAIAHVGEIFLGPCNDVPEHVIQMLKKDDMFSRIWNNRRFDMGDQSGSAYDLALANMGAKFKWTDQQIADAITARRMVRNDQPEKAHRLQYMTDTIGKAKAIYQSSQAWENIAAVTDDNVKIELRDEQRTELLKDISTLFGRQVKEFTKHGTNNSFYTIHIDDFEISLGPATTITNYQAFDTCLVDHGVYLEIQKKRWREIVRLLVMVAKEVPNEESSYWGESVKWMSQFLDGVPIDATEWEASCMNRKPFVRDDLLWIHADSLRKSVNVNAHVKVTSPDIQDRLRHIGFDGQKMKVQSSNIFVWGIDLEQAEAMSILNGVQLKRIQDAKAKG